MEIGKFIQQNLVGRLWHVTSSQRFQLIKSDGFIRPEPSIPDQERWSTSQGPRWFPFVRFIGGFSLFDFPEGFDIDQYRKRCPSSSLEAFIPYREEWGHAVWLEIDQNKQQGSLIRGSDVWAQCEKEGAGRRCMPYVEGAHVGDMPIASINGAYIIGKRDTEWRPT